MNVFSIRLKEVREERGLTQEDIALAIQSNKSTISMYESGSRRPSHDMIIKVSEFLNVSADYLIGLTDNPNEQLRATPVQLHQLNGLLINFFSDKKVSQNDKDHIFKEVNKLYWKHKE